MAKIKVTASINTDDLDAGDVDLAHESGLSVQGFDRLSADVFSLGLDDVEFALEK